MEVRRETQGVQLSAHLGYIESTQCANRHFHRTSGLGPCTGKAMDHGAQISSIEVIQGIGTLDDLDRQVEFLSRVIVQRTEVLLDQEPDSIGETLDVKDATEMLWSGVD